MAFDLQEIVKQAIEKRAASLPGLKESGKKIIGYFCCYAPAEIIAAAGFVPVRLFRGGSEKATAEGYNYTTPHSCPFTAGCIGFREMGEDPFYQMVDYLADAPVCLQIKRMLEIWQHYFGTPIIQIEFPLKFYADNAKERYLRGLNNFVERLTKISGEPLTDESLQAAIKVSNQVRRLFHEFYELLKIDQPPIQWRDLHAVIQASFLIDKTETLAILTDWKESLKQTTPKTSYRGRLLITGGMLSYQDKKLNRVLAELGTDFVIDELCTGARGVGKEIKTPTLEGIAEAYLGNVPCGALPYPDLKSDPRLKYLRELIKEYRINGVIYYTLRFCDAYSFKVNEFKKVLSEYGIPLLHVHSDYSASDLGQLRTRVEALLESIR